MSISDSNLLSTLQKCRIVRRQHADCVRIELNLETFYDEDVSFRQVLLEINKGNKIVGFDRKLFGLPVPRQLSGLIFRMLLLVINIIIISQRRAPTGAALLASTDTATTRGFQQMFDNS